MKSSIKIFVGYIVGCILVAVALTLRGDDLITVGKLVALWLPIFIIYSLIALVALHRLKISLPGGVLELMGGCIGIFPLFSGLWPIYWMRWDIALIVITFHVTILTAVGALGLFLQRFSKIATKGPDKLSSHRSTPPNEPK